MVFGAIVASACGSGAEEPAVDDGDRLEGALATPGVFRRGERCAAPASAAPSVVSTDRGPIRGRKTNGSTAFLGVPYAAPPLGALRWRPPQDVACRSAVLDTIEYGSQCMQKVAGHTSGSEDCLTLNIWSPRLSSTASLPVLFFVHGGAEVAGSSDSDFGLGNLYDGASLAEHQQVVVVTVNYRLGALGFLSHTALDAETRTGGLSGNYGLQDVISALQWVQANIANFGGDTSRVMLFGESAGALNTCALLASPLARGQFSSVLMQSGACDAAPSAYRQAQGTAFSEALGCTGSARKVAKCLRAKPAEQVAVEGLTALNGATPSSFDVSASWYLSWGPVIDGSLLPKRPLEMIRSGQHNHVPFVIGSNEHETELFMPPIYATCIDFGLDVIARVGRDRAREVFDRYPCTSYLFARWAQVDWTTDVQFGCQARRIARAMSEHQDEPVYRYRYTHEDLGSLGVLRAAHAMELPFLFDTYWAFGGIATPGETRMTKMMQTSWASLAARGNPGGAWPRFSASNQRVMVIDETTKSSNVDRDDHCDFWDTFGN